MVDCDDDIIVGAKKNISKRNYDKNDQKLCLINFKKHFIDEFKIDTQIQNCFDGEVERLNIRSTLWRMMLGAIPLNQNYGEWIDTVTNQRNIFKMKLKAYNNLKKIAGDPLGGLSNSSTSMDGWNSFFKDNELKKLINLDISRTYQDKELFQNTAIKELLINILFIWAKDNLEPSYRQGMNEILAILLFGLYPFYFSFEKKSTISSSTLGTYGRNNDGLAKDLYSFLYDEDELQADLYILFNQIMNRGILSLYCLNEESAKSNERESGKKKDLFQFRYENDLSKEEERENLKELSPIQRRCNKIYIDYLKIIDQELYNYLVNIDLNPSLILVRWLKCILNREFHPRDVIVLIDTIVANDLQEKISDKKSSKIILDNFNMLDYLCVSMITYIREDILRKDQVECLQRLFKYPPIESPVTLIKMAINIKSVVLRKLIFKEDSKTSSHNKNNNSVTYIQGNYLSNKNPSSTNHPLDKLKKEEIISSNYNINKASSGTTIPNINIHKSNPSIDQNTPIKINNINECIRKLEFLTDKYKEKVEIKDMDEFKKILEFLSKQIK